MNEKTLKKLKKFIRPPHKEYVLAALMTLIGAFCILGATEVGDSNKETIAYLIGIGIIVLLGGGSILEGVLKARRWKKRLKQIEKNGAIHELLSDFENGGKAFNNSLILGRSFLIGKKTGAVFTYSEIVKIYQLIHFTNGIEDKRMLKIDTAEKKGIDLCRVPLGDKADEEIQRIIGYITSVNNGVCI